MKSIRTTTLECGATLVTEKMSGVRSAGISCYLPAGTAVEPDNRLGISSLLSELLFRGAGDLDSRAFSDALDTLGVSRHGSSQSRHLSLGMTLMGEKIPDVLPLLIDMIRRPTLAEEALGPVRDLCLQSLAGLRDEPQERTMVLLKEKHVRPPFNRSSYGTEEGLTGSTAADVRAFHRDRVLPGGAIIGMAGDIEPEQVRDQLNNLLQGWEGTAAEPQPTGEAPRGMHHIADESAQVHIGIMLDAPRELDEHSMIERVVTSVLSGGMSGRLFTEVREKRSLCYAVHAAYAAGRDEGRLVCYAGTTPDRAQETLNVIAGELSRLKKGVEKTEFDRAVTGLKSRIIMHGESTAARASAIASDTYVRGEARSLDELAQAVDAVTLDAVNHYLESREPGKVTIATIGPVELTSPF